MLTLRNAIGSEIEVQVRDENGDPVPLRQATEVAGADSLTVVAEGGTEDDGEVTLNGGGVIEIGEAEEIQFERDAQDALTVVIETEAPQSGLFVAGGGEDTPPSADKQGENNGPERGLIIRNRTGATMTYRLIETRSIPDGVGVQLDAGRIRIEGIEGTPGVNLEAEARFG